MAEPVTAHLTAVVVQDGGWYVARCLEVEVASHGETVEDALDNLREALELQGLSHGSSAAPTAPRQRPVALSSSPIQPGIGSSSALPDAAWITAGIHRVPRDRPYFEDAPPVEGSHPIVVPIDVRIPA